MPQGLWVYPRIGGNSSRTETHWRLARMEEWIPAAATAAAVVAGVVVVAAVAAVAAAAVEVPT